MFKVNSHPPTSLRTNQVLWTTAQPYRDVPHLVISTDSPLGKVSGMITCPHCHSLVTTITEKTTSTKAWLISGALCVCCGCLGCCLVPLFLEMLKDVRHICPSCLANLGKFRT